MWQLLLGAGCCRIHRIPAKTSLTLSQRPHFSRFPERQILIKKNKIFVYKMGFWNLGVRAIVRKNRSKVGSLDFPVQTLLKIWG
ncbi:hypothetical protein F3Y22_tig00116939pilonHSYRG00081 [Hibiscus syriacus]|uniref:Uncharacterized protein n=1 Tax=Hibiscus syriacus TaxID=106335 RepID=A0A6A2WLV1_HIBSY|nr:hypothetical protein F3Y22_tig00116939pilonHSYRG00081 [Hibiscus syriacus]